MPPNILLITTDQQRYDTCGPAGPAVLRTPHLDQLADEGITYRNAYSDCPVCVPARISIMSGRTILSHGATGNVDTTKVLDREQTLPSVLRQSGYQTAAIGKMHFGPQRARHGFDEMIIPEDYYREMTASGSPLQPMRHGLGQNEFHPGLSTVPESLTLTSWTAERSVSYIRDRRDPTVPFFLWCSFSKPHAPLDPPEPYYSMYRGVDLPRPSYGGWVDDNSPAFLEEVKAATKYDRITEQQWRDAKAAYYGLITQIDYNVGRVLAALQDVGLYRETVILFTSDHGDMMGDHGTAAKCFGYEGSSHVPMILRLPTRLGRHGESVQRPVTLADVMPTLAEIAGAEMPVVADGTSLLGEPASGAEGDPVYAVGVGGANVRTAFIADGRWKYHWFEDGGTEQLFDLETDPGETVNLIEAAEARPHRERLRQALIAKLEKSELGYVADGCLVSKEVKPIDDRTLRASASIGMHTETWPHDVRH